MKEKNISKTEFEETCGKMAMLMIIKAEDIKQGGNSESIEITIPDMENRFSYIKNHLIERTKTIEELEKEMGIK